MRPHSLVVLAASSAVAHAAMTPAAMNVLKLVSMLPSPSLVSANLAIPQLGRTLAYDLLVGLGAATTAACWLLLPALRRSNALGFFVPQRSATLAESPAALPDAAR